MVSFWLLSVWCWYKDSQLINFKYESYIQLSCDTHFQSFVDPHIFNGDNHITWEGQCYILFQSLLYFYFLSSDTGQDFYILLLRNISFTMLRKFPSIPNLPWAFSMTRFDISQILCINLLQKHMFLF